MRQNKKKTMIGGIPESKGETIIVLREIEGEAAVCAVTALWTTLESAFCKAKQTRRTGQERR